MEKKAILEALKQGNYTKYQGVIEYYNENGNCTGVKAWSDLYEVSGVIVLAEPYSLDLNGSKWYYNREWNLSDSDGFRVVDLVESEEI